MLRGFGSVFGGEVPGKQLIDPVDRVLGNAGQDLAKISFRVQTVEFGGADQRVDGGSAYAAGVGPTKKVILPSKCNSSKRPFGGRVVYLQQSIVNIARERTPVRERIADGASRLALGGQ